MEKTPPTTVADTILEQLGGQRFVAMTGAKAFVSDGNMLKFSLPRGNRLNIKYVRIELAADDTYSVRFYNRALDVVNSFDGVYADGLVQLFELVTGLRVSL